MTYAIIRTGGKQFRAESGKTIRIPTLAGDAGTKVTFDDVILGSDDDKQHVGPPDVKGARGTGEIVKQGLCELTVVFKQKPRKNYAQYHSHRHAFTDVHIKDIA